MAGLFYFHADRLSLDYLYVITACQRAVQERARLAYAMAGRVNGTGHRGHNANSGPYANPRALYQQHRPTESTTPKFSRSDTPPDNNAQSSPAVSSLTLVFPSCECL